MKMTNISLLNGNIIASLQNGSWIYKADNDNAHFKKNGALKAVYHDLPRYRIITQYEKEEILDFDKSISEVVKDISLKLISFTR